MLNKKGGIASLVSLFTATIAISIILIGFFVLSGIVKKVEGIKNGEKVYNDGEVGLGNLRWHMYEYWMLSKVKVEIKGGRSVEDSLSLVDYDSARSFKEYDKEMKKLIGVDNG